MMAILIITIFLFASFANAQIIKSKDEIETKEDKKIVKNLDFTKGNTLYVGGAGPDNYTVIQEAIENATDGDTIFVFNGTYNQSIPKIYDLSINLIGENKQNTIIENPILIMESESVNVMGFTINNSLIGININNSKNINIQDCIITNQFYGIFIKESEDIFIENNHIEFCMGEGIEIVENSNRIHILNNEIWSNGWAIFISESCNDNEISENNIQNSYGGLNFFCLGIYLYENSGNKITNNTIKTTKASFYFGSAILLEYSYGNLISGNTIERNDEIGLYLYFSDQNKICKNNFNMNDLVAIYSDQSSDNEFIDNKINNNLNGIYIVSGDNLFSNNTINHNEEYGIYLETSMGQSFENNTINSNEICGIYGNGCVYDLFFRNIFLDNEKAIELYYCQFINIIENEFKDGCVAISLNEEYNDKIAGNTILDSKYGIYLNESSRNEILYNEIKNSSKIGVYLNGGKYNTIHHNNFIGCKIKASFHKSFLTRWYKNYWNRPRILPKIIFGRRGIRYSLIPWFNFDFRPARIPNKIVYSGNIQNLKGIDNNNMINYNMTEDHERRIPGFNPNNLI